MLRALRAKLFTPRRVRKTVVAGLAAATVVFPGLVSPAAADTEAAGFTMYTNERGANRPGLEQYGAIRATVVYDVFAFTCDNNGCYSNGGALPSQAAYEAKVREYAGAGQFGGASGAPVVLDFESIVVTALSGQAATNAFNLWKQLITWTKNAVPGSPVGMYGYDWETRNNNLTQQLHQNGLFDFFAPRAYWNSGQSRASWTSTLDAAVANDHALAPGQPIYPYIHSAYINGGAMSHQDSLYMYEQFRAKTEGAVMWEPNNHSAAADCGWLWQFSAHTGIVTGSPISGPIRVDGAIPGGSCIVPRGATTSIPVTVVNTTGSTTSATVLQGVSGVQGITGSFTNPNVPSLAAGATFTTTLNLTVPSSTSFSTALIPIRTGISNTRWAVIVQ